MTNKQCQVELCRAVIVLATNFSRRNCYPPGWAVGAERQDSPWRGFSILLPSVAQQPDLIPVTLWQTIAAWKSKVGFKMVLWFRNENFRCRKAR